MPYSLDRTDFVLFFVFFVVFSINGQHPETLRAEQSSEREEAKKKRNQVGGPGEAEGGGLGWESQVLVEIGRRLPKRPHARIMHGAIGVPQSQPSC